ncbi:MAG TPA: RICIN domain-containing protein [Trichormus sp. M33_DOE_039]|nr:RICIN domain-containing protein [Trichormus sp. M33_DOE_039]
MVTTPLPTTSTTNGTSSTQVTTVTTVAKIASGKTKPGATNWQVNGGSGILVDVDTSTAGFSRTPIYVTSIGGDAWHWGTTGGSSVYNATEKGFRIEIRFEGDFSSGAALTPEKANEYKWHVNWIAIEPWLEEGQLSSTQTSSTATTTTPASTVPSVGKYYYLIAKHSNKALDVQAASTADGGNVQQYTKNSVPQQHWQLQDAGGGYYYLVAKHSGKALNVVGGSQDDGANATQWSKQDRDYFKWQLQDAGDGYFYLIAKHSGKALDVYNLSTADAGNVLQWTKNGKDNQKWKFVPV